MTEFNARLHQILDDLADTMRAEGGVGIAGAQVGILFRVCLVSSSDGHVELVNPVITKSGNIKEGEEGCLSVEGRNGMVLRPMHVSVRAQDRDGRSFTRDFKGRDAVCVCHELDHLDGVLFIDKLEE